MTVAPQLSCDDIEALLPLVADGVLDATNEPALFSHVASCQRCQDSLAMHDLVSISLSQPPATRQALRMPRSTWQRYAPLGAAALLLLGIGALGWPEFATAPAAQISEPRTVQTQDGQRVPPADRTPAAVDATPVQLTENQPIDIEVIAVPGSTPDHPHYLVRTGEQVLFIDPGADHESSTRAPSQAQAAGFRRY